MQFKSTTIGATPEIVKRFNGAQYSRPITLDDSAFTNGLCKAGTPINADGEKATTTPAGESTPASNDAIGILWNDVYAENPNGSILFADAVINSSVAASYSGVTYDDALKAALNHLIFE